MSREVMEVGEVVDLGDKLQARRSPQLNHDFAVNDPQRRVLEQLARRLESQRFTKRSDRERLGRNWNSILLELKDRYGLKAKRDIYAVLQRSDSSDDPQKKSQQYEIPAHLPDERLQSRIDHITKAGKKWLKLAEEAAKFIRADRHYWLPQLLEGTSIAPPGTTPAADTPEPVTVLLDLANAACRKIATETDLENYFKNWSRWWVEYRHVDNVFRPSNWPMSWFGQAEEIEEEPFSLVGSHFYLIDEDGESAPCRDGRPFPSATFGCLSRLDPLGPLDGVAYRSSGDEYNKVGELKIDFCREFRLAIGLHSFNRGVAPLLEIRDMVQLTDALTGQEIGFRPGGMFHDIGEAFARTADEESDHGEAAAASDDPIHCFLGEGTLLLPDGPKWCSLHCEIERERFQELREALERNDKAFDRSYALEYRYFLLTPDNVKNFLRSRCFAGGQVKVQVNSGKVERILSSLVSGMGWLELGLLQGTSEGTLYRELLKDARDKVTRFTKVYGDCLAPVLDRHRQARTDFGSN